MNFFKRALKSTKAKWGRSLLLFAVFSAILVFVLAGLTIRSAAEKAASDAQKDVGATVTLSADRQAAFKKQTSEDETDSSDSRPDPGSFSMTPVSLSDAEKIAKLDNVKSYSFESAASAMASDGITAISDSSDSSDDSSSSDTNADSNAPGGGMPGGQMTQADFQIKGVSSTDQNSSFTAGTAKIVDGEGITADDKETNNVVIDSTLAEANDLAVGDTFTISSSEDEDTTYEMTVKGIYESSEAGSSMGMQFNFMNPANTFYTSYTFANQVNGTDGDDTVDSAVYTLTDPEKMDRFISAAEKVIDTDTFSLQSNDQMYQQMLQPLNNVASFSKNIVLLVAAAGVIILTLIIMITIRERRHELGVLLSLGESRLKIVSQLFTEVLVCMILAFGVAAVSGNLVANAVGSQLLSQQTETAQEQTQSQTNHGEPGGGMPGGQGSGGMNQGSNPLAVSDEVSELDIAVQPEQLGFLAVVAVGIGLFSVCLSSIGILRLKPRKILLN